MDHDRNLALHATLQLQQALLINLMAALKHNGLLPQRELDVLLSNTQVMLEADPANKAGYQAAMYLDGIRASVTR